MKIISMQPKATYRVELTSDDILEAVTAFLRKNMRGSDVEAPTTEQIQGITAVATGGGGNNEVDNPDRLEVSW